MLRENLNLAGICLVVLCLSGAGATPPDTSTRSVSEMRKKAFLLISNQQYEKAIPLLEEAIATAEHEKEYAQALLLRNNLGGCHFALLNLPQAVQHYQLALAGARKKNFSDLETLAAYNIASLHLSTGQHQQARAVLQQYPLDGSTMQADSRLESFLLQAATFTLLEEEGPARAALSRALREAEEEPPARLRQAYASRYSQWPEALRELRRAKVYSVMAQCLEHLNHAAEAEEYSLNAFRLRWTYNDAGRLGDIYTSARVARKRGNFAEATRLLESAEVYRHRNPVPLLKLLLEREAALLSLDQRDHRMALARVRTSLALIRKLRLNVLPSQNSALQFEAVVQADFYQAIFRALAQPDWPLEDEALARETFWLAEEARFASLKSGELGAETYATRFPDEYWRLLAKYQRLQTELFQGNSAEQGEAQRLEAKLASYETLSGLSIPQSNAAGTPRFAQWQATLPPNEVVYAFQLAEPRSLLWVVGRDTVSLHRIAGRAELRKLVTELRKQVANYTETEPSAAALTLSRQIFRDFPPQKGTIPVVTLVLDQELHDLPFAVLPSILNEKRFLLRDAVLRVAPSTAMPARAKASDWNRRAVAVADPVYNRADGRIQKVASAAVLGLNRLPGSGREAEAAMRTLAASGWETASYAGPEANPDQLRRLMEQSPDVLHVAAHFLRTQDHSPWLGLALSPDKSQTSIFGLADMRLLKTNSRVVVLSGCETQGGTVFPGLGVNGLARNFLVAGAESVLVTLWPIEDSAGPLFPVLYQQLVSQRPGPLALPRALRAAQLALLDSGQWSGRPDYWAAYVAITRG